MFSISAKERNWRGARRLPVLRGGRVHPPRDKLPVRTCDDRLARAAHEVEKEVQVVHRQQDGAGHLFLAHQVVKVGTRVSALANGAGARGVERSGVVREARVAQVELALARETIIIKLFIVVMVEKILRNKWDI